MVSFLSYLILSYYHLTKQQFLVIENPDNYLTALILTLSLILKNTSFQDL